MDDEEASGHFISAVNLAAVLSEKGFMEKIDTLRRFGFTKDEMLCLLQRCPGFLRLKGEYMVRKLEFLSHEVGMSSAEMIYNGWFLMFSLEARLIPRFRLVKGLRDRGLLSEEINMRKAFEITDDRFKIEFVDRFPKESDLIRAYMSSQEGKKKVAPRAKPVR